MSGVLSKPWSVNQFEHYRPELTQFIRDKVSPLIEADDGPTRILIRAPVKSGKREMVEYVAKRDESVEPVRVHAFVSAFHRKADEDQRIELASHNLTVFSLSTRATTEPIIEWINEKLALGLTVIIHFDEADYGSEESQRLNSIWKKINEDPQVRAIFYSATPEELQWSETITQDDTDTNFIAGVYEQGVMLHYTPPAGYCGARRFLDEGLVKDASRFFKENTDGTFELTAQGREIIAVAKDDLEKALDRKADARTALRKARAAGDQYEVERQTAIANAPVRNIIALRLSYDSRSKEDGTQRVERKAIYGFLKHVNDFPELEGVGVIVDKSELPEGAPTPASRVELSQIKWSQPAYWNSLTSDRIIIVVMDQTSSRSTEWAFHNRCSVEHDYRPNVTFAVVAQAQIRAAHYESRYGGFQPIRVYGHLKTWKLADERITVEEYMNNEYRVKKNHKEPTYRIVNAFNQLHPRYNQNVSLSQANEIMEELGCDAKVELSSRIRGSTRRVPKVLHDFEPCGPDTFAQAIAALKERIPHVQANNFYSPFKEEHRTPEGRYECPFRGEWAVREYPYFFKNRWGFSWDHKGPRIGVCYRNGECGIAIRYTNGEAEFIDTLETYRSMYVINNDE